MKLKADIDIVGKETFNPFRLQREFFPRGWQIIQAHEARLASGADDIEDPKPVDVDAQVTKGYFSIFNI